VLLSVAIEWAPGSQKALLQNWSVAELIHVCLCNDMLE